jgi:hypothetical protein
MAPVLELAKLSLAGVRHGESVHGLATLGHPEAENDLWLWYPSLGIKFQHGGGLVTYCFVFLRSATRDWLCRTNGVDVCGPTMDAFSGQIKLFGQECGGRFLENPEQVIAKEASGLFREYRREAHSTTFILNGDPKKRRLHLEYDGSGKLHRIILY